MPLNQGSSCTWVQGGGGLCRALLHCTALCCLWLCYLLALRLHMPEPRKFLQGVDRRGIRYRAMLCRVLPHSHGGCY